MRKLLFLIFICVSILFSTELPTGDVGRYQLETITYTSKKGIVYVVETILDTKSGKVVVRRKTRATRYKLPYKDRYNKIITKE
jgi:hypothetical protein